MIYHLFTGTRTYSIRMVDCARREVLLAILRGEYLIVGDAWGMDEEIIKVANEWQYANISVYGWGGRVRHKTDYGKNHPLSVQPKERNNYMVDFLESHVPDVKATAIWDRHSGGTSHTLTMLHFADILCELFEYSK